jgi:hypothetical protein
VLDSRRKPVGYIDVGLLKTKWEAGTANPVSGGTSKMNNDNMLTCGQSDSLASYMTKFERGTSAPYTVITPETPLEELEEFLHTTDFAIGKFVSGLCLIAYGW